MATMDNTFSPISSEALAFHLGWSSADSELTLEHNPYGADESQHQVWIDGWQAKTSMDEAIKKVFHNGKS